MSPQRIWTVAALELTQRRRTARWPLVLGVWFLVIAGVASLTWAVMDEPEFPEPGTGMGGPIYDVTVFFVLGLALLVVPALTSTSVNGDREQGVLATLQTTLVTSWELVLGKLLASWIIGLVFLATASPFLVASVFAGGISPLRVLTGLVVLVVVMAVVCAIGLVFSTLTARPVASAVLTYLVVAALTWGSPIVFGLSVPLVTTTETVRVLEPTEDFWANNPGRDPSTSDCVTVTRTTEVTHTEWVWWLLMPNPFVLVADAAPYRQDPQNGSFTPMMWISEGVRAAKTADEVDGVIDQCTYLGPGATERTGPVWPYGFAAYLLMGGAAVVLAERRVRTPVRRLPAGTRIA